MLVCTVTTGYKLQTPLLPCTSRLQVISGPPQHIITASSSTFTAWTSPHRTASTHSLGFYTLSWLLQQVLQPPMAHSQLLLALSRPPRGKNKQHHRYAAASGCKDASSSKVGLTTAETPSTAWVPETSWIRARAWTPGTTGPTTEKSPARAWVQACRGMDASYSRANNRRNT